jgi:hypothetical protein
VRFGPLRILDRNGSVIAAEGDIVDGAGSVDAAGPPFCDVADDSFAMNTVVDVRSEW